MMLWTAPPPASLMATNGTILPKMVGAKTARFQMNDGLAMHWFWAFFCDDTGLAFVLEPMAVAPYLDAVFIDM